MPVLVEGRGLVESPRWHEGRLWFADWIAGEIVAVDTLGRAEVVVRHTSLPLCFDFAPDGRPLIVSGPQRALVTPAPDGSMVPYADLSKLSSYGSNDIVIDGRANAYVDNPGYDPMSGPPPDGDIAPGSVALVTPDGSATMVADDLAFPNGMAVTADNATLLVAESHRGCLTAFDMDSAGRLSGRRVWATVEGSAPDGICLDAEGAAWFADVPNRRCVRVREGGDVLQTIDLEQGAYACMLGGRRAADPLHHRGRLARHESREHDRDLERPGACDTGQRAGRWLAERRRADLAERQTPRLGSRRDFSTPWSRLPGETPGQWWEHVGSEQARTAAAIRDGYTTDFDLDIYFMQDIPAGLAAEMYAREAPQSDGPFGDTCAFDAWPDVPLHVIAGRDDRFFPLELQQRDAPRAARRRTRRRAGGSPRRAEPPCGADRRPRRASRTALRLAVWAESVVARSQPVSKA